MESFSLKRFNSIKLLGKIGNINIVRKRKQAVHQGLCIFPSLVCVCVCVCVHVCVSHLVMSDSL